MLTLTKSLFALMLGFISSTIFGLIAIPFLKKLKAGQNINIYVEAHRSKAGTPTMGGLIFIIPTIAITVFLLLTGKIEYSVNLMIVLFVFFSYALIGFLDDFISLRRKSNKGLTQFQKLLLQLIVALVFYVLFRQFTSGDSYLRISALGIDWNLGWFYGVFILFLLVGSSNAVNLTDGLDGLAAINGKDGATLSTNTPYTYQVGEQDGEITIQANSAKGFDSKQYKLIIHSLEKDYFPNLQYTVKENDKTLDIGNGNFLNDAWNYKIELKQDAVCTIAVQDQTNESQPTYHWSHRIQYQQQILNDSSSNSVTVNTKDFATSGNFYDLRAVRIVDDYTYAVNVQFSYTLNHITHINAPQITSQPASANYQIGESAKWLSISASALAGTVKYQWYKNSANDTETGVPIEGAIQRSYQPEVSDHFTGTTYYYCKAKAVYKGADNKEIVSEEAVSTVAAITVALGSFPWKGKGTEAEPYLLTNTESITQLRDYVNKGISMENICFKMTQDISLPKNWTPIGCTADGTTDIKKGANLWAFSGTIDGDNKTLTVPKGEKPLLGYVKGAAVKNLVIYGEEINGYGLVNNFEGVGLEGSAIIVDNVTLKSGTKTLKSGILGAIPTTNGFAGVSAGFTAIIRNCTVEEGVVIGYDGKQTKIGSIAGRMQGVIENCTSKATVQGINDVGGIVGARDNALGTCTVKNCKFSGVVEASGDNAGGIAGGVYSNSTAPNGVKMTIQACTVDGNIQGMKNVGGILGAELYVAQAWDAYAFIGNFFSGTIQGKQNIGGIIGRLQRGLHQTDMP